VGVPLRKRALMCGLAALPLAAVCLALLCWPRDRADWTPRRLHQALRDAGLAYEGRQTGPGTYCLKSPADPTPWEELPGMTVRRLSAVPGRLRIARACPAGELLLDLEDGYLQVDQLVIAGHPEDLRRIVKVISW
jgi:hypothetical protein